MSLRRTVPLLSLTAAPLDDFLEAGAGDNAARDRFTDQEIDCGADGGVARTDPRIDPWPVNC
jgi:hypothetical protein